MLVEYPKRKAIQFFVCGERSDPRIHTRLKKIEKIGLENGKAGMSRIKKLKKVLSAQGGGVLLARERATWLVNRGKSPEPRGAFPLGKI